MPKKKIAQAGETKTEEQALTVPEEKKPFVFNFYGEDWNGKYDKVTDLSALLGQFKQFYYDKKFADVNYSAMKIIQDFNKVVEPMRFYPYPQAYRRWRMKWDADIAAQLGYVSEEEQRKREIINAVKLREVTGEHVVPAEEDLEAGARTLAGILVNDAQEQLLSDKEMEEMFSSDELIKRKNYALNVFQHVIKAVQNEKNIKIKANAEKRETAGFLMDILQRATAGKLTEDDLALLRSESVTITTNPIPAAD